MRSALRVSRTPLVVLLGGTAAVALAVVVARGSAAREAIAPDGAAEAAIAWSANRLVALQNEDGGWPVDTIAEAGERGAPGAFGARSDPASIGTGGRSLLWAWNVTRSPLHLRAARRAADALVARLPGDRAVGLPINGIFLAETARATGDARYEAAARTLFRARVSHAGWSSGKAAARTFRRAPVPAGWEEPMWRNVQTWRGLEEVELALRVGERPFAREMAVELLRGVEFEPGEPYWSAAASRAAEVLQSFPGDPLRFRGDAILADLLDQQVAPGLVWSDSPEDGYVYAIDNASFLRGLATSREAAHRDLARRASAFFVDTQLGWGTGGWSDVLALDGAPAGAAVPEEVREYPGVNAEVLTAIARLRRPVLGGV